MAKKQGENHDYEFRYYEVAEGEPVLALLGDEWLRPFGLDSDTGAMIDAIHFHNLFEIGYCTEGCGEVATDKEKYHFESGYYTIIPPNYPHVTNSFGKSANSWEYLFFDAEKLLRDLFPDNDKFVVDVLHLLNSHLWCFAPGENDMIEKLIRSIFDECRKKEKHYAECIRTLFCALFIYLNRNIEEETGGRREERTGGFEKIRKSLNYTKQNYLENLHNVNGFARIISSLDYIDQNYMKNLRVEDLAVQAEMSATHYRRKFLEYLEVPPMEYVNFIRIRKACELLLRTDYTMEIIAEKVGYTCESTFNRNFRKMMSVSPNHFRKSGSSYLGKELGKK